MSEEWIVSFRIEGDWGRIWLWVCLVLDDLMAMELMEKGKYEG